jgi:nucleotide-binding universal stress UspA family protein
MSIIINDKKILGCVDHSIFAHYVADYAAWTAMRLNAPLELLHVRDRQNDTMSATDHSGFLGVDAEQNLLNSLSDEDEARSKAARVEMRLHLNRLRERVLATGVESVDVRQRYGQLEDTLIEQESGVRLFVLGRRGQSAEVTQRDLGRNVERIARSVHKPILTIGESFTEPHRIMIAFDGSIITRRGVELVAASPMFRGMTIHLLMSGKTSAAAIRQLEWARTTLESAGFDAPASLVPGDAESIIARTIKAEGIDMLVMGAYSHTPLRSLLIGSKTSDLLRSTKIPTMLLR